MATTATLSALLRTEIGDRGASFVWTTTADGLTNRYEIPHHPVDGATMVVQVDSIDVSPDCEIEETTGVLTFDEVPQSNAHIVVAGTVFRYFTEAEITNFIANAFAQHTNTTTLTSGSRYTIESLPTVEDYPVVVLAASLALQTLATDASFDIDISAPDGVMIPRSQRYRQLMEMAEIRKQQYKDLCAALNIGLWRIETHVVRRVSNRTNRLSPLYIPQEIDDRSMPVRIRMPIPTYGAVPPQSEIYNLDFTTYRGDDFESDTLDFPFDLTGYDLDAQIRDSGPNGALVGVFTINVTDVENGVLTLSLTGTETHNLPERSFWDLQATNLQTGKKTTYFKGSIHNQYDITNPADPRASGWRGITTP